MRALLSSAEPSNHVDREKLRREMSIDEWLELDMKVGDFNALNPSASLLGQLKP